MLYAAETVPVWNPETDGSLDQEIEKKAESHVDEVIEQSRHLRSMTKTQGWGIVEEFLGTSITRCKDILAVSQDYDQIKRLQEAIKAYVNVQVYVQRLIETGENFQQERTPRKEG